MFDSCCCCCKAFRQFFQTYGTFSKQIWFVRFIRLSLLLFITQKTFTMSKNTFLLLFSACFCLLMGLQTKAQTTETLWITLDTNYIRYEYEVLKNDPSIKQGSYKESWVIPQTQQLPFIQTKTEGQYDNNKQTGKWTFYNTKGKVETTGFFKDDLQVGQWATYWKNGQPRYIGLYNKGKLNGRWQFYAYNGALNYEGNYLDGNPTNEWLFYKEDGSIDDLPNKDTTIENEITPKDSIYNLLRILPENQPHFFGGEQQLFTYLSENIKYPAVARENGIEGTVYIEFIISKQGFPEKVVVKRGIEGGCNEEALRVIKQMPRWIPGRLDGKPIRVKYTLPIKFKLQ